jgi:hypothetical protein
MIDEIKNNLPENAVPLIVIFGVPDSQGVTLNWFSTSKYDSADSVLKADTKTFTKLVPEQLP